MSTTAITPTPIPRAKMSIVLSDDGGVVVDVVGGGGVVYIS